jgi:hypothetical protein
MAHFEEDGVKAGAKLLHGIDLLLQLQQVTRCTACMGARMAPSMPFNQQREPMSASFPAWQCGSQGA